MTHASLFSGIGGFDLAAEWAGWTNVFNCEIDSFCRKVLKYHFPDAEQYEDIKKSDFSKWRDRIDVLTGGFPCQPFSLAGKRKGTDDDRYLWPAMLGVIRTVRPRWVVGENVYGIVNWSDGLVFDTVCSDLETAGYEVQPYIIPACGVGAPHRRDRVWFVAHYKDDLWQRDSGEELRTFAHRADTGIETMREGKNSIYAGKFVAHADGQRWCQFDNAALANQQRQPYRNSYAGDASDAEGKRLPEWNGQSDRDESYSTAQRYDSIPSWENFPTKSPVRGRNDGLPGELAGLSFPAWCRESIKACGNAIVPQVALQIFKTIEEYEKQ